MCAPSAAWPASDRCEDVQRCRQALEPLYAGRPVCIVSSFATGDACMSARSMRFSAVGAVPNRTYCYEQVANGPVTMAV